MTDPKEQQRADFDWTAKALIETLVARDEDRFRTIAFLKRHTILAALEAAGDTEILEVLWQYESDLLYPPEGDSRERRLERVRKVIAKGQPVGEPDHG